MPFSPQTQPPPLQHDFRSPRWLGSALLTGLATLALIVALIPLGLVLVYVAVAGGRHLRWSQFLHLPPPPLGAAGGFGNALLGTVIMVVLGTAIALPLGVAAAIYLAEFGRGPLATGVRLANKVLSGVPSIVVGVFVYGVLVVTLKTYSAWAGGVAIAILMLPLIVASTDEALQRVPPELRQAAVSLGARDYQMVLQVVLPAARPAIVTGTLLAIARAAGETAPLLFTALFTPFWPQWQRGLLEPTASLSVMIYNFATSPFPNQQTLAFASSLVLMLLVLLASLTARFAAIRRP